MSHNSSWTLTQTGEARTWTLTQDGESRTFTIAPGVGPAGPAGPSNITTSTSTDITGILKGDGANVGAAVADTDYQSVPAEGAFADGDKTKLDGIESGADVTDAANVNAAGAVMESDYSPAHSVLAQQSGTGSPSAVTLGTNSILGRTTGAGTAIRGLGASDVRTMLNVEDGATADQTDFEILTAWENASSRSATIDGLKLDSIEPNATADQTASEILTAIKTVDGTGSGLDADLLDGQDSTAFAASSHTHTVDDLDFAGSTDIAADLADADEILVSDGGGNTTRRKSALSRLWTYIKAKIESVALSTLEVTGDLTVDTDTLFVDASIDRVTVKQDLYSQASQLTLNGFASFDGPSQQLQISTGTWDGATIAGDQTMSGQVELTGQTASTDDSAMTRELVRDDFLHWQRFEIRADEWDQTSTGAGNLSVWGGHTFQAGNVGSAGSTLLRANPSQTLWQSGFENANYINWGKRYRVSFACWSANQASGDFFRFQIGEDCTKTTISDLDQKGIGIKVENGSIYALTHDGTTLTTSASIGTLNSNATYFVIDSDGSGNVYFYRNGTLIHTATGTGPTGYSSSGKTAINWSLDWAGSSVLYVRNVRNPKIIIGN
jgi:hypothetical protein